MQHVVSVKLLVLTLFIADHIEVGIKRNINMHDTKSSDHDKGGGGGGGGGGH